MSDRVRIYRSFTPKSYYLLIFNGEDYQYQWKSRYYRWLWLARWHGVRAARKYLKRATSLVPERPKRRVLSLEARSAGGLFEHAQVGKKLQTRIFIEQVTL